MTRRAVQSRISIEALGRLIGLNEGQKLVSVFRDEQDLLHGTIRFVIESDQFQEVHEGCVPMSLPLYEIIGSEADDW